jgi:hypothetical protein
MYAAAVASNICGNESKSVIQIPVSLNCSEEIQ